MKPYLRNTAFLLLIILAGCTSTPSVPPDGEQGGGESLPVVSPDSGGGDAAGDAISGEIEALPSEPSGKPSQAPSAAPPWPEAPHAGEIPLPEGPLEDPPEPFPVFPHIIQAEDPVPREPSENNLGEEALPPGEKRVDDQPRRSPDPVTAVNGRAVIPPAPGDRTSSQEQEGISRRSAASTAAGISGVTGRDERVPAATASSEAEKVNLALPGWNSVETREERVYTVSPRDPHILILEGAGWTLQSGRGIHTNLERSLQPGVTVFTFLLPREGTGELVFQRQDLSARIIYLKTVSYRGENPSESDSEKKEALEAVSEVVPPEQNDPAAEINSTGDAPEALAEEGFDLSLAGAAETALPLEEEEVDTDSLFNAAARFYNSEDYHALALVLGQLQGRELPFWEQDRLLLFLGRLHDLGSPLRDEKAALDYYTRLVDQYPGSLYWDEANRRARYIRRHFFQIR